MNFGNYAFRGILLIVIGLYFVISGVRGLRYGQYQQQGRERRTPATNIIMIAFGAIATIVGLYWALPRG